MSQLVQQELERQIENLAEYMTENDITEVRIKPAEGKAFVEMGATLKEVEIVI
jgi:hypothetical protein